MSRDRIDAIDQELQRLISERATLVHADGVHLTEQDARALAAVLAENTGPLDDASMLRIFREILDAGHALSAPYSVAYLGPEGTYSHAATQRHFGQAVDGRPQPGIAEIFRAVEGGQARFGVAPVENSTEGTVNQTLDLLMGTSLRICGEVRVRIEHRLLSRERALGDISSVHAHPQALAQCRHWLEACLPGVKQVSESSNAEAARLAALPESAGVAAIAGEAAAVLYALETLESGIEDIKTNTTRFIVVGDHDAAPSGRDTTSLLIGAPHRPGGLLHMLEPFEVAGVSMTRIESRPSRDSLWDYVFFIDVEGHQTDSTLAPVIAELRHLAPRLRVLGSYPAAL